MSEQDPRVEIIDRGIETGIDGTDILAELERQGYTVARLEQTALFGVAGPPVYRIISEDT